jgi:hypothetical protein
MTFELPTSYPDSQNHVTLFILLCYVSVVDQHARQKVIFKQQKSPIHQAPYSYENTEFLGVHISTANSERR